MGLISEADVDPVLAEKMIQLQSSALDAFGVPACQSQGFPVRPLGGAAILGYEKGLRFSEHLGFGLPRWEKLEQPTSQHKASSGRLSRRSEISSRRD